MVQVWKRPLLSPQMAKRYNDLSEPSQGAATEPMQRCEGCRHNRGKDIALEHIWKLQDRMKKAAKCDQSMVQFWSICTFAGERSNFFDLEALNSLTPSPAATRVGRQDIPCLIMFDQG